MNSNRVSAPINYRFSLLIPNTTSSTLILGNTPISGIIDNPGDEFIYTINGIRGQRLYFDGLDVGTSITASLFAPSNLNSFFAPFRPTRTSFDSDTPFIFPETGPYQLKIQGLGNIGMFNFRMLNLDNVPDLIQGTDTLGNITVVQQSDFFKFQGRANQQFVLENLSSTSSLSFVVYGPGNKAVTPANVSASDLEFILPGDGTYYLGVSSDLIGLYTFRWR